MPPRIVLLDAAHERASFDCGDAALNDFLRHQAGQQQRRGFGKTYVALDDAASENGARVTGFVTVCAGQVASSELAGKLPRHPAPVLRIARLGVDVGVQGQGLGRALLAFALHLALDFSERVGLYAVVVDAKHEHAAAFYRALGFVPTLDAPLKLYLPLATLAKTR